jgi:hypothetical protein
MAAQSLNRVAPDLIVPNGVVPMLVAHLKAAREMQAANSKKRASVFEKRVAPWVAPTSDHRGYYASGAAKVLGEIGMEPGLAVPALIEAVLRNVGGINAVRALASFPEHAQEIEPVLLEALDHPSGAVRLSSDWALNEIEAFREKNTERP